MIKDTDVMPHRAAANGAEDDQALGRFLKLLASDITLHPARLLAIDPGLIQHTHDLVAGVELDLDAPLQRKDE